MRLQGDNENRPSEAVAAAAIGGHLLHAGERALSEA